MDDESPENELIRLLKFGTAKKIRDLVNSNPTVDLHCPTDRLTSPLLAAIERSDPTILMILIDKVACDLDSTLTYPCAKTALMHAAFYSSEPEILHLLVKKGADPNKTDINGRNCLFYAVIGKRLKNVVTLLDSSEVSIESRDSEGRSPLMISVYLSNLEIFEYLLNRGAEVNALDKYGLSALHIAILKRKRDCVIKLKKFGADVELLAPFSKVSALKLMEELLCDILPVRRKLEDNNC